MNYILKYIKIEFPVWNYRHWKMCFHPSWHCKSLWAPTALGFNFTQTQQRSWLWTTVIRSISIALCLETDWLYMAQAEMESVCVCVWVSHCRSPRVSVWCVRRQVGVRECKMKCGISENANTCVSPLSELLALPLCLPGTSESKPSRSLKHIVSHA